VVAAAAGADLLILARDGDRSRLGPKSLGPADRFVVDHAPCPVLLVWQEDPPGPGTIRHHLAHPVRTIGTGSRRKARPVPVAEVPDGRLSPCQDGPNPDGR
jgi:hypothetical protein